MTQRYRVVVSGPLPMALAEEVRGQLGQLEVRADRDTTVLEVSCVDQPSLRGLLTRIFDNGLDVVDVTRVRQ
jgi:hypothetical protein